MRYDLNQDNQRRQRRTRISRFVLWCNPSYSSVELIARDRFFRRFDARDVTGDIFRVTRCSQIAPKIAAELRFSCHVENPRLHIGTKPKRKARVILRDISKLMSEKNFEWKIPSREREREREREEFAWDLS